MAKKRPLYMYFLPCCSNWTVWRTVTGWFWRF